VIPHTRRQQDTSEQEVNRDTTVQRKPTRTVTAR
jgi:hypothetical protein